MSCSEWIEKHKIKIGERAETVHPHVVEYFPEYGLEIEDVWTMLRKIKSGELEVDV